MGRDVNTIPVLKVETLFRKGERVYLNKSTELEEYCEIMHKHDFIEIAYVISGSGYHRVGGYEYHISQGDLFIINYDVPHGFVQDNTDRKLVLYNCNFMPDFIDSALLSSNNFHAITSSFLFKSLFPADYKHEADIRLTGARYTEIGELFEKMYNEYNLMKKGYSDIIRAYLIELIIKIFRYMEEGSGSGGSPKNRELVEKALEYLKKNYDSDIRLEDLAIKSFISKNYFSKLFKEVTGINFSDYVQKLRIDEACSLLRNTDMKVTDILYKVGFKDIKFFYDVFKKITGKTPGDFRKLD